MALIDVQTQVAALLNRRDCTMVNNPGLINTFIQQGIQRIQRNVRIPAMERAFILTAADAPIQSFQVPGDLLQIQDVMVANSTVPGQPGYCNIALEKMAYRQVLSMGWAQMGRMPHYYARQGASIFMFPYLPPGSTVTLTYYGAFAPLQAPSDINEVTNSCPDLLVYGALSFAADYYIMDQKPAWEARFGEIMGEVIDEAEQLDHMGGPSAISSAYGDW